MLRLILIIGACVGALLVFSLYRLKIMHGLTTKEVVTTFADYKIIQPKFIVPVNIVFENTIPLYAWENGFFYSLVKKEQKVKKGQLLAYIKIQDIEKLRRKEELKEIKNKIKDLQELIKIKEKEVKDAEYFFKEGVISKKELASIYEDYKQHQRELEKYLSKYKILKIEYAPDNAKIISPIDGVIIEKSIEDGTWVSKGSVVFKLVDLKKHKIIAKVSEYDLEKCKRAKSVVLESEFNADEKYQAKIGNISMFPDNEGNFTISLQLLNNKKNIPFGRSYIAKFLGSRTPPVLAVPIGCVFEIKGKSVVYLTKNERIKIQEVEVGISDEEYIEIKRGLSKGDEVVMIPYEELKEGDKIKRLKKWE